MGPPHASELAALPEQTQTPAPAPVPAPLASAHHLHRRPPSPCLLIVVAADECDNQLRVIIKSVCQNRLGSKIAVLGRGPEVVPKKRVGAAPTNEKKKTCSFSAGSDSENLSWKKHRLSSEDFPPTIHVYLTGII